MSNDWLKEGIELYNHVSYHWSQCHVKKFPTSGPLFEAIRKTAIASWIGHIAYNNMAALTAVIKPATPWITDWCTFPLSEKRQRWEDYFCSVMLRAKNFAKLLNQHETISATSIGDIDAASGGVGGEPKRKRTRRTEKVMEKTIDSDGPQYAAESMEYKIQQIVQQELKKLGNVFDQLQSDADMRQGEVLKELNGHIEPINKHLQHLSRGQSVLYNMIDGLNRSK
jgi:hypothetical protein